MKHYTSDELFCFTMRQIQAHVMALQERENALVDAIAKSNKYALELMERAATSPWFIVHLIMAISGSFYEAETVTKKKSK